MWTLTKLWIAGTFTLLWFQSSNPNPGLTAVTPSNASVAKSDVDFAPSVGRIQPVITVNGVCAQGKDIATSTASACTTVITREQFERMMNALNPAGKAISLEGRENLARVYAESVALEAAARKSALEDTDEFRELMSWTRLRVAADLYRRKLQDKYRNPAQEEIDAYYQEHLSSFERVELSRILVPRRDPSAGDNAGFDKRAFDAANIARARAAKGEDPDLVEKEIYRTLGLSSPPPTTVGAYGRANFTEKEGPDVFSLKAGEVTQVEIEPKSYVIYKVNTKETLPEEKVKAEIAREISQQKFKAAIKAATDVARAEFDERYFSQGMNTPLKAPVMPATPPVPSGR